MTDAPSPTAAMAELSEWAQRRARLEGQRGALVAAAWRAGERRVSVLASVARVARDTIYADLRASGIDPTIRDDRQAALYTALRDLAQMLTPATGLDPRTLARLAGPVGVAAATLASGDLPQILDAARELLRAAEVHPAAPPDTLLVDESLAALRAAVDAFPVTPAQSRRRGTTNR